MVNVHFVLGRVTNLSLSGMWSEDGQGKVSTQFEFWFK